VEQILNIVQTSHVFPGVDNFQIFVLFSFELEPADL
jgi:hypothetical protein